METNYMTETQYLNREELLSLNEQAVLKLGGNAGIQSPRAFEVILDQPKQVVFGQEVYPTIWLKAAYMMQQIIKTPVFVDGSKRTAGLVVLLFLQENGYQPLGDDYNEVARDFILEMVQSDNSEETMKLIGKWLSNHFTQSK
ncbi:hypothetical protein IV69_GL001698 [Weissella confusa]|nr:hypothetical protein IV69_GL001698 [Weissella confusa]